MKTAAVVVLLLIFGLEGGVIFRNSVYPWIVKTYPALVYPELRVLSAKPMAFDGLSKFFTNVAQRKGALYAFEILKVASLPPDTDLHLLGHIVGDELYKQKGIGGIVYCTQDFRNACSHSIVVGYFLKYGEAGLPAIADTCRKAPGGKGAYTMCFHGLGHGILAAVNYELPQAVALCLKTGTAQYGFREGAECVGGTIMEIISGGFHSRTLWEKATVKYLKTEDPLYPCDSDMIPQAAKPLCYDYITPHLVQVAGGDLSKHPSDEVLSKAFSYCQAAGDSQLRASCYQGFGKEFVVLAHARDIRNFDQFTDKESAQVYRWCSLANDAAGVADCVNHAVDSLYWGGENSYGPAIRFCKLGKSEEAKRSCFSHLSEAVKYFTQDVKGINAFCSSLPAEYSAPCKGR